MSRSLRKPWYVDGYGTKWKRRAKTLANSIVRKNWSIPSGMAYKKFFCSWNICDYKYRRISTPYIYMRFGEQRIYEPEPLWKVGRK